MKKIKMGELTSNLTIDEKKEINEAEKKPIMFDEDSPEMTPEKLRQFKRLHQQDQRNKQTISLRVSPSTLNIAKAYGKGYTSFLSRLLDEAIKDESLVKKCI